MSTPRALVSLLLAATSLAAVALPGSAQTYPERPVKFIVPYAPGGVTDGQARVVANGLGEVLGQSFVIENKPGASGAIAIEQLKKSDPDGYTFLVFALSQAALLPAVSKTKFEPGTDYTPVTNFGRSPLVLAVNPAIPARTPQELVTWMNGLPNPVYSSPGAGTTTHISMAAFMQRTGMKGAAVVVRGGTESITNLMTGHVPVAFMNASDVVEHTHSGKVRILAVTSPQRIPQLPDVPTMVEAGYPNFGMVTWNGLAAPVNTPAPIVEKIAAGVAKVLSVEKNRELMYKLVVTPVANTPAEFAAEIVADIKVWGDALRASATQKTSDGQAN